MRTPNSKPLSPQTLLAAHSAEPDAVAWKGVTGTNRRRSDEDGRSHQAKRARAIGPVSIQPPPWGSLGLSHKGLASEYAHKTEHGHRYQHQAARLRRFPLR